MNIFPIKIGWDYDDIIHPWYHLAHRSVVAAGLAPAEPHPTLWAPYEQYEIEPEAWYEVLDAEVLKGMGGMYGEPLDESVKWQLHRTDVMGFENHVVTARGTFGTLGHLVKDLTQQHIDREGLPVKSLHFGPKKHLTVNKLGLHYFIDDSPRNYESIEELCPNTEVYLMDQPWNQDLVVPEGRRLHSVEEYVDLILHQHARLSV